MNGGILGSNRATIHKTLFLFLVIDEFYHLLLLEDFMSAIALNNRVTSDSDAAFASCTVLPIHQTTLNVEEMAGIDGVGSCAETLDKIVDYVSDVVDSVGDYVSAAATTASIAVFGGATYADLDPDPFAFPLPPDTLIIITREPHVCDGPYVYSSYGSCLCPIPGWQP